MLPVTMVTLTNMVLNELGRPGVANISNDDSATVIAQRLNTFIPQALLRENWVWTLKQKTDDTPRTTTPNNYYNYSYQLPPDYGRIYDVETFYDWQVIDGTICTNVKPIVYFYNVNYSAFQSGDFSIFPPEFQDYLALFVAARVGKPLTQDLTLCAQLFQAAEMKLGECIQKNRMEQLIKSPKYNAYNRVALFA